jgi:hypothetical protein
MTTEFKKTLRDQDIRFLKRLNGGILFFEEIRGPYVHDQSQEHKNYADKVIGCRHKFFNRNYEVQHNHKECRDIKIGWWKSFSAVHIEYPVEMFS